MARLLSWPIGLAIVGYQPLTGPRTQGAAATESIQGFVQTVASVYGAWRYTFSLRSMRGALARRHRGLTTGLHGGANAVRVPFCDPDIMSWEESGVDATTAEVKTGTTWSNGMSWENDVNWAAGRPWATIAVDAALGASIVVLEDEYWGHSLQVGDWIGFVPEHFGKYDVTEVIEPGRYRIWPPLRKAITTDDWACLSPVMAMRPESEAAALPNRGQFMADGNTLTLVEVQDEYVREYFLD